MPCESSTSPTEPGPSSRERRRQLGRPPLATDGHRPDVDTRGEVLRPDVELAVPEAVHPQHLGVQRRRPRRAAAPPCPASAVRCRRADRGRRGRRRCTGGRRPGRRRRVRRTWLRARRGGVRGSSAPRPDRRRRRWPRPARAGRCPARPARRHRRRPRSRAPAGPSRHRDRRPRCTTPSGTYGMARASANEPPRTSYGRMPWVRSTTVTWGARSRSTALTTPTNSSSRP